MVRLSGPRSVRPYAGHRTWTDVQGRSRLIPAGESLPEPDRISGKQVNVVAIDVTPNGSVTSWQCPSVRRQPGLLHVPDPGWDFSAGLKQKPRIPAGVFHLR